MKKLSGKYKQARSKPNGMNNVQIVMGKYLKFMKINDSKTASGLMEALKPETDLPSLEYLISTNLSLLSAKDVSIIDEMLLYIETHPAYFTMQSLSDCFTEWQYPNKILRVNEHKFKSLKQPFITCVKEGVEKFVTVLKTDHSGITYLDMFGNLFKKTDDAFFRTCNMVILIIEAAKESGTRQVVKAATVAKNNSPRDYPSIIEILKVALYRNEAKTYKLFRAISIFFTYIFVRLHIRPFTITILWLSCILGASFILAMDVSFTNRMIAAGLIFLHYILDCSDGEVARITRIQSKFGNILEQVVHWVCLFSLIVGISMGLYRSTGNPYFLIIGLFCLLSDSLFHFILYFSHNWRNPRRRRSKWQKYFDKFLTLTLPINPNIFFWALLFNFLEIALLGWAILGSILAVVTAITYLSAENKDLQKRLLARSRSINATIGKNFDQVLR